MVVATQHKTRRLSKKEAAADAPSSCLGGGGVHRKSEMLRFVAGPDGYIYFDITGELPGNAGYITPNVACIRKALETHSLENTLGATLLGTIESFQKMVLETIEKRLLGKLGLLRKAGQLLMGCDNILDNVAGNNIAVVFYAEDIATNTLNKLKSATKKNKVPLLAICNGAKLDIAFDKGNCTVIALRKQASIEDVMKLGYTWVGLKELAISGVYKVQDKSLK